MTLLNSLKKNPVVKILSSIKITVVCLWLLFILTLWGTVTQVNEGLYVAQERYFHSFYFITLGFIPFPGAQLVLWVMFFNLCSVATTRFVYKRSHIGILIIHLGLLTYFVSAFVTLHVVEESQLTLEEKAGANVAKAYHDWEVAAWEEPEGATRHVYAYDDKFLKPGTVLEFPNFGSLTVEEYFTNADAYLTTEKDPPFLSASKIEKLVAAARKIEPEKNIPGGTFTLKKADGKESKILLYGGEAGPLVLTSHGKTFNLTLRHKHFSLPFFVNLNDFEKKIHAGTEMAKSFQSRVEIEHEGVKRDVLIYMNHPLRVKDYTLYQASYSIDEKGREYSTLAVVKNAGRLLPYISSGIVFAGLLTHFLMMAFRARII